MTRRIKIPESAAMLSAGTTKTFCRPLEHLKNSASVHEQLQAICKPLLPMMYLRSFSLIILRFKRVQRAQW